MKKQSKGAKKQPVVSDKFAKVNNFLKIISDKNRMKILLALKSDPMNVTQIHTKLRLPQNLTSHHLSKLKSVGLLNEKHKGTFRNYSLNAKNMKQSGRLLKELLGL